ncbi:MAG: lyase domain protein repeat-containing protein, partial [Verrucomicrobiales bacterium]|nr:lyase domain protein repeat-containing protein [Verrucomicrobiales bacterium]
MSMVRVAHGHQWVGYMRGKKIILIGGACVLGILLFGWFQRFEPTDRGKPISFWLGELRSEDTQRQQDARKVFREMGGAQIRYLITCVRTPDSRLRQFFSKWHIRVPAGEGRVGTELLPTGNLKRAMAATALGVIRPVSNEAIQVLFEAADDKSIFVSSHAQAALIQIQNGSVSTILSNINSSNLIDGIKAASVLYPLQTNSAWIASKLTNALNYSSRSARFDAVQFLCGNELDAGVAWPIILSCLMETNLMSRVNALNAAIIQLTSPSITSNW